MKSERLKKLESELR
ncbi:hypothetical protein CP8484711_0963A, partial [Chlamydia psittaci 84-8471/1]